jgi:hypothetical protein
MNAAAKFLIIPGLPKSGTTFLAGQLRRSGIENRSLTKELRAFREPITREEFVQKYFTTHDPQKWFVDASPVYFWQTEMLENALRALAPDVKFVLCLRTPMAQAVSHYLHDIINHLVFDQWAPDFSRRRGFRSIVNPYCVEKYFYAKTRSVRLLVEALGNDSILTFNFHKDFDPQSEFWPRLNSFLGEELAEIDPANPNPLFFMPYFLYNAATSTPFVQDGVVYTVPKQTLVFINGRKSTVWHDVPGPVGRSVLEQSLSWTTVFDAASLAPIREVLEKDFLEVLSLLRIDRGDFPFPEEIEVRRARVTNDALAEFPARPIASCLTGGQALPRVAPLPAARSGSGGLPPGMKAAG